MAKDTDQLTVDLPKDLMANFRKIAMEKGNYKKGAIKAATIEALELWLKTQK